MHWLSRPAVGFLFCLIVTGCSDSPVDPDRSELPRALTAQETSLIESDNLFGLNLFRAISAFEADKNVFISPLSISMALGMTLNGADGTTYEDMKQTLQLAGLTEEEINQSYRSLIDLLTALDPMVVFQIANSIWYRDVFPISQPFVDLNQEYFDAEVAGLDFNDPDAANVINQWVSTRTNGRIDSIVDSPIDALTVMILINAIYFKGDWTYKFDVEKSISDQFTLPDDSTKLVSMMVHDEGTFPYFENTAYQIVDLAYGDSLYTMTIVLPKSGTDIDAAIETLDRTTWESWINQLQPQEFGILQVPRFELEYEIELNGILSALGMEIAFDPFNADFTRMRDGAGDNLYITGVKHKTYINVDEDGTEAAAVTSVTVGATSVPEMIVMKVNRPFIFMIRERISGTILFIGKIVDPAP